MLFVAWQPSIWVSFVKSIIYTKLWSNSKKILFIVFVGTLIIHNQLRSWVYIVIILTIKAWGWGCLDFLISKPIGGHYICTSSRIQLHSLPDLRSTQSLLELILALFSNSDLSVYSTTLLLSIRPFFIILTRLCKWFLIERPDSAWEKQPSTLFHLKSLLFIIFLKLNNITSGKPRSEWMVRIFGGVVLSNLWAILRNKSNGKGASFWQWER